jgi:hypothetical protein
MRFHCRSKITPAVSKSKPSFNINILAAISKRKNRPTAIAAGGLKLN